MKRIKNLSLRLLLVIAPNLFAAEVETIDGKRYAGTIKSESEKNVSAHQP